MSWRKDEIKGRAKEAAGVLTDDESLKREGQTDQLAGDVKRKAEKAIDRVKDAAEQATDGIKRAADKVGEAVRNT